MVACAFAFALTGCGAGAGGEGRGAPSAPETTGVDVTVDDEAFCSQLSQVFGRHGAATLAHERLTVRALEHRIRLGYDTATPRD